MYFFVHFTVSKPGKVSNRRIVIATDSSSHDLLPQVTTAFRSDYLSARGVTTVPGLNLGCITYGRDWESHRVAHNWPCVVRG